MCFLMFRGKRATNMVRRSIGEHRMSELSNHRDRVRILRYPPGGERVWHTGNGAQTSVLFRELKLNSRLDV